jgi:hypothetical protein
MNQKSNLHFVFMTQILGRRRKFVFEREIIENDTVKAAFDETNLADPRVEAGGRPCHHGFECDHFQKTIAQWNE